MPSPFLFLTSIFFMLSISAAQYGTEEWLHPGTKIFTTKDTSNFMQLYNYSHIGVINFDDSLHITENMQGFKYIMGLDDGVVRFNYNQYHSITEFIEEKYSFSIQNIYNEALIGYEINKGIFTSNLDITKYSGIHGLSPSVLISTNLYPSLICRLGKSITKVPFKLTLNYTDFIYSLNNIYTVHEIFYYGITLKDKNYKIDYMMEEDNWIINANESLLSSIELNTGNKRNMYLNGVFYLRNKREFQWAYFQRISKTELDFNNNFDSPFIQINNFTNDNYVLLLNYKFIVPQYLFNISFMKQESDWLLSDRIYPSKINYDLETFFLNGSYINNKDVGAINQHMITLRIKSLKSTFFHPTFQLDWTKDNYDINLDTKAYLLGIPTYINNQTLNIIGKEAINLRFGLNILKNNWSFVASFSQHIPYKIDLKEKIIIEEEKEKEEIYGGGLFQLSITKYLD